MKIYNEIYKKQRKQKRKKLLVSAIFWLLKILLILFLSFATIYFFGQEIKINGNSMSPTIEHGDKVLVNKISSILFSPRTGDLIVFKPNGNPLANTEIRRVVGVPGDKLKISNGYLYVNGNKIIDDFHRIEDPGIAKDEIKLAEGEYFVLSDNREIMQDSRNVSFGTVKRSYCTGKAWFIGSPSNRRGFIK